MKPLALTNEQGAVARVIARCVGGHVVEELARADALGYVYTDSDTGGVWRTIRGRHVFIRDGEDIKDALARSLAGTRPFDEIKKEIQDKHGVIIESQLTDHIVASHLAVHVEKALAGLAESAPLVTESYKRNSYGAGAMTVVLAPGKTVANETHNNRALAYFNVRENRMMVAGGLRVDLNRTGRIKVGVGEHNVGTDFHSVFAHEMGHGVSGRIALIASQKGVASGKSLYDSKPKSYWQKTVSTYAGTNHRELMAEAFSAYTHPRYSEGKSLPPEIVKVFEAAGVKPSTRKYALNVGGAQVDYAQIARDLDELEDRTRRALLPLLINARNVLIATVRRREGELYRVVPDLKLAGLPQMRRVLRAMLRRAWLQGGEDARAEVGPLGQYAEWDESKHPRNPAGDEHGGEFAPTDSASAEKRIFDRGDKQRWEVNGNRQFPSGGGIINSPLLDRPEGIVLPLQALRPGTSAARENAPFGLVKVDKLISAQDTIDLRKLQRWSDSAPPIQVAKWKGRLWVMEGNHRAASAWAANEKEIRARILDLDDPNNFKLLRPKFRKEVQTFSQHHIYASPSFTPLGAVRWMNAKELFITGLLGDKIIAQAKGILVNAIKTGEAGSVTAEKLWNTFEAYIGDPNVLRDGEPLMPYHLDTIIRTNTTEAYNHGRIAEFVRPDMLPFLDGIRYSAIMDSRTTPVCQFLDGKVFLPESPDLEALLPPNHFNCRSIVVPIVAGEKIDVDEFITPKEVEHARELADAKFLAQWDESAHPRNPKGDERGGEFAPAAVPEKWKDLWGIKKAVDFKPTNAQLEIEAKNLEDYAKKSLQAWIILGESDKYGLIMSRVAKLRHAKTLKGLQTRKEYLEFSQDEGGIS